MKWIKKAPLAITVTDRNGVVIDMNEKAVESFGKDVSGKSLYPCHSEKSKAKIDELFNNRSVNAYTIEKNGVKKLIYQFPWYEGDDFGGYVELSIVLPETMPHFIRK